MTKKVVDVNYLSNPKLGEFLRADPRHRVVLTDYLAMESYNSNDPVNSIAQYLPYIVPHADQVLVLKGTRRVVSLSCRGRGLQKRLVDEYQTKSFKTFCDSVEKVMNGDRSYDLWLRQSQDMAKSHLNGALLNDVPAIEDAMDAFRELFTAGEMKEIRREGITCKPVLEKLPQQVMILTLVFFKNHKDKPKPPRLFSDAVNTFMFRLALTYYIQTLLRFSTGADATVNPPKHRNDMVDCSYVTYASFFDGLLTSDKRLNEVYFFTRAFLDIFTRG